MGIMPNTARALGVTPHELKDPDIGIRTGVDCLRKFRQGFSEITDPQEKIKFTLASYNAGIGHVYDAQRLAEKYGKNPLIWEDNVAEYIRLKAIRNTITIRSANMVTCVDRRHSTMSAKYYNGSTITNQRPANINQSRFSAIISFMASMTLG